MISFIIPAYNAEKTIIRAIESIINQKNTSIEYEIIVINDGSKDKTEENVKEIIDNYAVDKIVYDKNNYSTKLKNKDNNDINFFYYQQENQGISNTRNLGVKKSNGDYIIFVDSDDYVSDTLLNDIEKYIDDKIELIKWNPIFVKDNGEIKKEECFPFDKKTGVDGFNYLYGKDKLISCLWNYAIKKELIPEFPKVNYHEDFAVLPLIILKAKSMVFIDKNEYYYVQTDNSVMRGNDEEKQKKRLEDILFGYDYILNQIPSLKLDKYTDENLKIFLTNSLIVFLPELSDNNKKFFLDELSKREVSKNLKTRNLKQLLKKCFYTMLGI